MSGREIDYRGALEAVERILNRGGDASVVLLSVLEALHKRGVGSSRVRYVEAEISVGDDVPRIVTPVTFRGDEVGSLELSIDDSSFAERVATLISAYVSEASASSDTGRRRAPGARSPSSK